MYRAPANPAIALAMQNKAILKTAGLYPRNWRRASLSRMDLITFPNLELVSQSKNR